MCVRVHVLANTGVIWAMHPDGTLYAAGQVDLPTGVCVTDHYPLPQVRSVLVDYPHAPDGTVADGLANHHSRSVLHW